ncbi:unnamed protein product, partial [Adineta ricciae]
KLSKLYLKNNFVEDVGSQHLGNALRKNRIFDSANSQFGTVGIQYLADALQENTTLLRLHFEENDVGDLEAQYLANILHANRTLNTFLIGSNPFGHHGAHRLADALCNNLPKLCPAATSSTIGSYPYAVFIDQNNKIYVTNQQMSSVQVWINDSSLPKTIAIRNNNYPISLFVTDDGTIYVDDNNNYVTSWLLNKTGNQSSLYTGETCYGLFIDKNNSLYCSLSDNHIVITRSLNRSDNQTAIVAGSNCFGFLGNSLYYPRGIIVDTNYSLCVADCQNHRVQLFRLGAGNTTTIAGWGPPVTITLYYPSIF